MIMGRAFRNTKWRPSPVSFCRRSRSSTRAQKGRLSLRNGRPNKTQRNPKTSKTSKISKTAQAERITAMRSAALIASLQFFHRKRKIRTNLQLGRLRSDYSVLVRVAGLEPTASWTRTMRATSCATPGKLFYYNLSFPFCQVEARKRVLLLHCDNFGYFVVLACKRVKNNPAYFSVNWKNSAHTVTLSTVRYNENDSQESLFTPNFFRIFGPHQFT